MTALDDFQRGTIAKIIATSTDSNILLAQEAIATIERAGYEIRRKPSHAAIQFEDRRLPSFQLGEK